MQPRLSLPLWAWAAVAFAALAGYLTIALTCSGPVWWLAAPPLLLIILAAQFALITSWRVRVPSEVAAARRRIERYRRGL